MTDKYQNAKAALTTDAAYNATTGQGTDRDKTTHTTYAQMYIDPAELANIYRYDGIGRKLIDKPVHDMLKNWRTWSDDKDEVIHNTEWDLGIKGALFEAQTAADVHGGSVLVMIVKGQSLDSPLDVSTIGKGDLQRVAVFDRNMVVKLNPNFDIASEDFMKPEFYQVRSTTSQMKNIHPSRVIEFGGDNLILSERLLTTNGYWMQSKFYRYWDALNGYNSVMNSTEKLMQEANIDVISIDNLPDITTTKMSEAFEARMELHDLGKSVHKVIIKDKEEEFQRHTLNLSNVDNIIGTFQTALSAVSLVPTTELFGTSAKGLNATGEGDERSYHQRLEGDQMRLERCIAPLDEAVVRSAIGDYPDDLDYTWNPLRVQSDKDKAEVLNLIADASGKFIGMGSLKPEEVRVKLDSQQYFNIENPNEVIEPPTDDKNVKGNTDADKSETND